MTDCTLEFDDFDALRRLICKHSGIWLNDSKMTFLQVRLGDRLRARNISSAREYYRYLKYDPRGGEEMQRLIDAVTVNETWFFRETGPVEAWCETVLPELVQGGGQVRVWSAGCATGEEPYTLAMLLLNALPPLGGAQIEVLATDISRDALEAARAGVYDPYSLRHTDAHWQTQYFQPAPGGQHAVSEEVRRVVRFGHANLVEPGLAARVGPMDAVLCRNVIIYFDDQSRRAALDNLCAALKPGGHLILGHAESLVHASTSFELTRVDGTIMYQKP